MARTARFGVVARQRSYRLTPVAEQGLKEIAAIGGVTTAEFLNRMGTGDEIVLMWLAKWLAQKSDKPDNV